MGANRIETADRIARRVAAKRELASLAKEFACHSWDAAAGVAAIGAVGAAVTLALVYISLH